MKYSIINPSKRFTKRDENNRELKFSLDFFNRNLCDYFWVKKIYALAIFALAALTTNAQTWQWAKSAGGTSYDYSNSISTDAGGNVFVTGSFTNPAITFGTTTLTNAGSYDIFVVKYDASGTVLWAKAAGGTSSDAGSSVSTDAGGNVFVTGFFSSDSLTFGTTTLINANANNADIFIVKYDASGTVLWAKATGGIYDDYGNNVSTDAGGNVFVTGSFWSDSVTFGTTTLINADNTGNTSDIFIVKYAPSGTVLWAKSAGGTSSDAGASVSTDAGGNVFVTGIFYSQTITFGTTTLTNASASSDMFIAKLDGVTGIEENNLENEITVYPNPTSGTFTIQLAGSQKQEASIEICNVMGEKVYSMDDGQWMMDNGNTSTINHQPLTINLDIPIGMYFYQVKDKEKIIGNGKVIIK